MKKLMGSLLIAFMMVWLVMPVMAAGGSYTTPAIQVSAEIVPLLQLTLKIHDGQDFSGSVVTLMNFDKLVLDNTALTYSSSHVFTVEATALSSGRKYNVTQTGTQLTAPGGDKLPVGCEIVTPNAMNVSPNPGAHYGSQQSWVGSNETVYTSNNAGQRETLNARYTLSSDPGLGSTDKMDADLHGGLYTATVTYTLTLN